MIGIATFNPTINNQTRFDEISLAPNNNDRPTRQI